MDSLRPGKQQKMEVVHRVDFGKNKNLAWNILFYLTHEGLKYRLFWATGLDWDQGSVDFSIREGLLCEEYDEIPVAVSRLCYTFSPDQIIHFLEYDTERFLTELSETFAVVSDDKGRRCLKHPNSLDEQERVWYETHFLDHLEDC